MGSQAFVPLLQVIAVCHQRTGANTIQAVGVGCADEHPVIIHIIRRFVAEKLLPVVNGCLRHAKLRKNILFQKFTVSLSRDSFNNPRKQIVIGVVIVKRASSFFLWITHNIFENPVSKKLFPVKGQPVCAHIEIIFKIIAVVQS